jgi:hypothetical protein
MVSKQSVQNNEEKDERIKYWIIFVQKCPKFRKRLVGTDIFSSLYIASRDVMLHRHLLLCNEN